MGRRKEIHDAGIDRSRERQSHRQAARRGSLSKPALPAGYRDGRQALTPRLGTRSTLRLPAPRVLRLIGSPAGSAGVCAFVSATALPPPCRPDDGPGSYCSRWPSPLQRPRPRARAGPPRFPGSPSCDSVPVHDPGRPVAPRRSRRFRCYPQIDHTEGVVIGTLEAHCDASSPAVYASRRALPHAMQDSLPAGGLRLCRAGVEPAGQRRKGSDHLILLPRTSPGARSILNAD